MDLAQRNGFNFQSNSLQQDFLDGRKSQPCFFGRDKFSPTMKHPAEISLNLLVVSVNCRRLVPRSIIQAGALMRGRRTSAPREIETQLRGCLGVLHLWKLSNQFFFSLIFVLSRARRPPAADENPRTKGWINSPKLYAAASDSF